MGLLGKEWKSQSWIDTIVHGISENAFCHPLVNELAPYSEFVDFHCKLRPFFHKEFAKVKSSYFPGCNGEALYIGKLIRSCNVWIVPRNKDHQGHFQVHIVMLSYVLHRLLVTTERRQ